MHKIMYLISEKLQKKDVFVDATTCSLGELDEQINHMKISKS
jgi:hypothetical protein